MSGVKLMASLSGKLEGFVLWVEGVEGVDVQSV